MMMLAGFGWWLPTAEEWSAWWAFTSVVLSAVTLVITAAAAFFALRQLTEYVAEQEERARPFLVVDFDFHDVLLYLTVRNISATPATEVTLTATPRLRSTLAQRDEALADILGGAFVIPQIAPGRTMRWLVDRTPSLFERTDLPHRVEVVVEYTDPRARPRPWPLRARDKARYSDRFPLDLDQYGEASDEQNYDNRNWNIAVRNEKRLEAMSKSLTSVASTLDTLLGVDEAAKTARRREPMLARRRRRQEGRE